MLCNASSYFTMKVSFKIFIVGYPLRAKVSLHHLDQSASTLRNAEPLMPYKERDRETHTSFQTVTRMLLRPSRGASRTDHQADTMTEVCRQTRIRSSPVHRVFESPVS